MNTSEQLKNICNDLVIALTGPDLADKWWSSPNKAFDNRTPNEQWDKGSDQVINYLMHHSFVGGGS